MLEKNCIQCNKVFQKKINCSKKDWETTKLCSRKCHDNKRRFEIKICSFCKVNTVKRVGKIYCSKECFAESRKGESNNLWKGGQTKKECLTCKQEFSVDPYRKNAKTCSLKCGQLYRKTEEFRSHLSEVHRSKIDDKLKSLTQTVSQFRDVLRRCTKYKMWRQKIMIRDNFTCQICKVIGGKLCIDHIKPFVVILFGNKIESYEQALKCKELWDMNNGRTLCYPCHRKTDTYGSKVLKLLSAK